MAAILALDAGTTGITVCIYDENRADIAAGYQEFPQYYPEPGWVEHDAMEIWETAQRVMQSTLADAGIPASSIAGIGIANQRETTVVWDRASGRPIHNAIVWQDRRTRARCDDLHKLQKAVQAKTGLKVDPYFSATKIEWILQNVEGAPERAAAGDLAFGTIDSWLLFCLTGTHATDVTNASRTMLWDIHSGRWDSDLCSVFGVPDLMLPEVWPSAHAYGTTDLLGTPVPVLALVGDQQAALFGQGCVQPGAAKCTYGTGAFLLQHTGTKSPRSKHGLLTTRAASLDTTPQYALEGSVFVAGAAVQWFRDGLGLIRVASELDKKALTVDDSAGVVMVPALTGMGAPHWDARAQGAILGITRGSTDAHVARACLDGIAHQVADLVQAMEKDSKNKVKVLRVDGGATRSDPLLQIQADLLGRPVSRGPEEATVLGAALLAGIQADLWSIEQVDAAGGKPVKPAMKGGDRRAARKRWERAVKAVRSF